MVPISWYVLYKTPFGLRLRSVGENPEAADAAGVPVRAHEVCGCFVVEACLAGIGGAYLSIGQSSLFTRNMTSGRGFIASGGADLRQVASGADVARRASCLACTGGRLYPDARVVKLPGFLAMVLRQTPGDDIPVQFIQMVPYVLTIVGAGGFHWLSRVRRALWASPTRRNDNSFEFQVSGFSRPFTENSDLRT